MRVKKHSFRLSLLLALLFGAVGFSFSLTGPLITPMALAQSIQTKTPTFYGRLPLNFERNQGQMAAQVKFIARGSGYNLFLTSTEAVLALQKSAASKSGDKARFAPGATVAENRLTSERSAVRMKLVGANPNPHITGLDKAPANVNYFIGNEPAKWRTNLPTYNKVRYERVYPGVDLIYYGNQQQLEYDFVVAPGADPTRILLDFAGVDHLVLNPAGDLVLQIANEQIRMHKPLIYQEMAGVRQEIAGGFVLRRENQIAFQIGQYDTTRTLIIDPVLTYAGYLGGSGADFGNGIVTDSNGSVYIVGYTDSAQTDFPVVGGPDLTYNSNQDLFVAKLTADGTQLVYRGYIGGSGQEFGMNIAVDGGGNAYIIGYTNSTETTFPVIVGPDLSYNGGLDTFVAKLSPNGAMLLYAGYIGGAGNDFGNGIAVDGGGNIYIVGTTTSTEATFPVTVGPDLTFSGPGEGYVAKVNADGASLLYAGYIGGNGDEAINAIALEPDCPAACQAYVAGSSASDQATFPVIGGPDLTYNGGTDAFVAKVKEDGAALVYNGYIGGSGADYLYSIAVDQGGNAYVYGNTDSNQATFPVTVGPGLIYQGGRYDAFIAKLNATGTALAYAGYIGGAGDEFGRGIAVDAAGNAYISGWTNSTEATFPVRDGPDLTYNGGPSDVFVAKVNAAGAGLDYAGYIGGNSEEITGHANPIAVDRAGNSSYLIGATNSNEATFPVTVGPDLTFNGAYDSFVAKIVNTPLPPTPTALPPLHITTESPLPSGIVGQNYAILLAAAGGAPPYHWSVATGDLPPGLNLAPETGIISGVPTMAGAFAFTIQVTDSSANTATKPFGFAPSPPSGNAGSGYTLPINIEPAPDSGGSDPGVCTTYSVVAGVLPAGLTLDPNTGIVNGTPTNGGTYNFTIGCLVSGGQNAGQTATKEFTITIYNPAPTIINVEPAFATVGGPAFVLTVNGANFVTASIVQWNGANRTTNYGSATQLQAQIPATDIAAVGTANITIVNPQPGGGVSAPVSFVIRPAYHFSGFFPPVDNPPVLNVVKAGSAIPVKFSLGGNQGLAILAVGYPVSQQITCETSAPLDEIEQTVTAGSSTLSYDPVSDQYTYVWNTDKAWANSCRQLTVRLVDDVDHQANFKFK